MSEEERPASATGYRKPPAATRFAKGRSGNPKGRPRGRRKMLPYDAVLGQTVMIREDGVERRVNAAEAFLLHMTKRGLEGDGSAARAAMTAIEQARATRRAQSDDTLTVTIRHVAAGRVGSALEALRMAVKLDRFRPTARIALEPWLVEAALARLGDARLSRPEQEIVIKATRTPKRVNWPAWWEVKP